MVGVLLGSWQKKILDVSNSFAGELGVRSPLRHDLKAALYVWFLSRPAWFRVLLLYRSACIKL